jgi:hypothetical protein
VETTRANDLDAAYRLRADAGARRRDAFIAPAAWRETFRRLIQFSDGQIRFVGLTSMLIGLILLMLFS